jgi:hypothetical protein
MRTRALGALLLAVAVFASCTPEKRYEDRDGAYYGLDIVFCDHEVAPTESCNEVALGSDVTVFANVVASKASGRVIQVESNGPLFGTVKEEPLYVPRGESFSQWLEINPEISCRELPCTIAIDVYVDDELILTESFTFA